MSLPLTSGETDRQTQRGRSDAEAHYGTTEADLTLFPPVSPPGSPCWSAPRLPLSTPGRTGPRIRGCGGDVCACVSAQHPQLAPVSHIKRYKFFLFFPPSRLVLSSPLLPGTVWSVCVCMCDQRQAACPVREWPRVCVNVCVSSRAVTVCHTGGRAGRQRCVHFIIAVMTGISSQEEWLPRPHTRINTPPPTSASQFTLTNTSWTIVRWTVPLAGTEKTSEERERERKGGGKKEGKERH